MFRCQQGRIFPEYGELLYWFIAKQRASVSGASGDEEFTQCDGTVVPYRKEDLQEWNERVGVALVRKKDERLPSDVWDT
ncbi:hypothetical protein NDU88_000389 [Pleurodeles waltl]|uniref:Uncharacterized protein n=1 Tax=Pleurodeles waltl TaxID=8319 RepID=A0AAV7TET4_PLEWA|nr:hypothetical protein NDU88_000389 [Pleurodeles waltl]